MRCLQLHGRDLVFCQFFLRGGRTLPLKSCCFTLIRYPCPPEILLFKIKAQNIRIKRVEKYQLTFYLSCVFNSWKKEGCFGCIDYSSSSDSYSNCNYVFLTELLGSVDALKFLWM